MPNTLTITGCVVEETSITVTYSAPVDSSADNSGNPTATSALNPANYSVYDPAAGFPTPTPLDASWSPQFTDATNTVVLLTVPGGQQGFNPGDFVLLEIRNIALATRPGVSALIDDPVSVSRQVPNTDTTGTITRNVEDAVSYPILTEEIGYRPSPVGIPVTGGGMPPGGGSSVGQVALKAVTDVLGWKANASDPKGFIGALTQPFTLTDVEGHVQSTWTPRTYAVQTDLGGGITGAQASLYLRAKDALDQSLSLLDGLYPLDPEADPEYVKSLREMARSQMTEIVKEFGVVGLPSILRIDTYFGILLGQNPVDIINNGAAIQFDPDQVGGTLGTLRDTYGIFFANNPFNNSVEDEQDITNFRVISDYMTSLMQSWISNRSFFVLAPDQLAFFGTQLVLISRQFNVIVETVNEVRFALDSVFIGPSERQTLLLEFADLSLSPMFLEDVLDEVEKFVSEEGPRLLRDGGKISVTNNILPVVQALQNMVEQAHNPTNINELPDGFSTQRVRNSLDDLQDQLGFLISLTEQVEQQVPPPEGRLTIHGVSGFLDQKAGVVSIIGDGFEFGATVTINSALALVATVDDTQFYSSQRIDVFVADPSSLEAGQHEITVVNPSGDSVTITLPNGISFNQIQQVDFKLKRDARAGKAAVMAGKNLTADRKGLPRPALRARASRRRPAKTSAPLRPGPVALSRTAGSGAIARPSPSGPPRVITPPPRRPSTPGAPASVGAKPASGAPAASPAGGNPAMRSSNPPPALSNGKSAAANPASAGSSNPAATPPPQVSDFEQKIQGLQDSHDQLKQGTRDVADKVQNLADDVGSKFQNLQASHQELRQGHQTLLDKLEDMTKSISRLTDLFGTKKKDKGD
jgi:hypothetical protein